MLARRGKFFVAEPFFGPGPRLVVSRDRQVAVGDLIVVRAGPGRNGRAGGRATIAWRLGRSDVAHDVIEGLMVERGLRRRFDPAVEHEARELSSSLGDRMQVGRDRRDLRSLPTFTVDPVDARDFDDAISAAEADDGSRRVWVHIADVSAYVASGSLLDREAYRRGTSVYVPGAVEPMLPQALSNHVCSLVPGQDRLAVTVEMLIDGDRVRSPAFYRSVIRSDERLDYDRVDRIFAGQEYAGICGPGLAAARAAAAALAARRGAQGALEIGSTEPEFEFDERGDVVSIEAVEQTESHRMIEHLMIAANEQVAQLLTARRVPTLYRVHERPDGIAAERLIDQLASLGVPTPPVPKGHIAPQQAAELIGEASHRIERWTASHAGHGRRALTSLVLRSLKQAYYDHRNIGHAGLQSPRYCHFTSPIRRYPDLICHRALLSAVTGDVPAPESSFVVAAGPWTSACEREAMSIERDADDVALCFLLERSLLELGWEKEFEGEVVGLIGAGAFVAFGPELTYEGMLPVRRMRGDWWELNEEGTMLQGAHTGRAVRLGDPVRVRVGQIDAPRGRVDLLPAWEEA